MDESKGPNPSCKSLANRRLSFPSVLMMVLEILLSVRGSEILDLVEVFKDLFNEYDTYGY